MNEVRCLACGEVFELFPQYPMCPRRYLTPHDEQFMGAVAEQLGAAGALEKPTVEQHRAAIKAALDARRVPA